MVVKTAYHVLCTTFKEWEPSAEELSALDRRAEEIWPDHLPFFSQNREKWKSAIRTVRNTSSGWVLDQNSGPRSYY